MVSNFLLVDQSKQDCCPVHPCIRASVRVPRNIVNTISCRIFDTFFTKLTPTMHNGTEMKASQFGVKKAKVNVTVE